MNRRIDVFTILSTIFTLLYTVVTVSYILEYYSHIRLIDHVNETLAYTIAYISTLGGTFIGESQGIVIAWSPIIAVAIGIAGWFSREKGRILFLVLPICTLIIPLIMLLFQTQVVLSTLYYTFPFVSLAILVAWSIVDWFVEKEYI